MWTKEYRKKWREKNPDYNKNWKKEHFYYYKSTYSQEKQKQWRKNNSNYNKIWKEKHLDYNKKWKERHPDYYQKWKERHPGYNKQWYKNHRKLYYKIKISKEQRKLNHNMSSEIRKQLKGQKRWRKWEKIVGYNIENLIHHLEKQFKPTMNWKNYGKFWHIDHIIPKCQFKFKSYEDKQFRNCWSLNNLRPLESYINLRRKKFAPILFNKSFAKQLSLL